MIGAQRTGTNLLREILNTNEQIAMLGEILSSSPAPAHWENFCAGSRRTVFHPRAPRRPRRFWTAISNLFSTAFEATGWAATRAAAAPSALMSSTTSCDSSPLSTGVPQLRPFFLSYLKARGATLIHTTRRNVIHCAISAMIAGQRNFWHNYEGAVIDRRYFVDAERCLQYAQAIVSNRDAFLAGTRDCKVADCCYEDLTAEIARAAANGEIPDGPGPLRDIAKALRVPFRFRYDGRLRKAINVPYFRLLLNQETLSQALRQSEFAAFDISLGDLTIRGTSF